MNNIQILDCTLRDGGYCNGWKFGFDNIKKITHGLLEANVEIVECFHIEDVDISKLSQKYENILNTKKI